jgi:hypothetical protein
MDDHNTSYSCSPSARVLSDSAAAVATSWARPLWGIDSSVGCTLCTNLRAWRQVVTPLITRRGNSVEWQKRWRKADGPERQQGKTSGGGAYHAWAVLLRHRHPSKPGDSAQALARPSNDGFRSVAFPVGRRVALHDGR